MKRSVVFYAAAYAVSLCTYWVALRIGFAYAGSIDTPGWWMRLVRGLQSINTWHALTAILATFIVSVPLGLAIARLVGRHAILVALSSALTVFVVASLPWVVVGWPGPWRTPRLVEGIALCTVAVAPALVVSLTRMLPSNNRWRGP
jgi:hypothetical protein